MGNASKVGETFDYLIVGGGTAGCVLAARLSANPNVRVLLLEAGPDFPAGIAPEAIASGAFRAHHDPTLWSAPIPMDGLGSASALHDAHATFRVPQVIGGGSSVNGMHAQRGLPEDYDGWAAYGVRGWSWNDVLPYFTRLESDHEFAGAEHGGSGPISITRVKEARWSGLSRAIAATLETRGVPRCDDLMTCRGDCVAPVPLNLKSDRRASVAASYLNASVRQRRNLMILCRARVERLVIESGRVAGVDAHVDGAMRSFHAHETIVSAGAIGSPLLLLRSGIGPAEHLTDCAIPVHVNRPGVGRGLRNHAHLSLGVHLRPAGRQHPAALAPCTMVARYSSRLPGAPRTDMMLNVWERTPGALQWDPLSRQFAVLMVLLNAAYSTGELRLDPADPLGAVRVRFNVLQDPRDFQRMVEGVRLVAEVLSADPVSSLVCEAFFPRPNTLFSMLNRYDWRATTISLAGSLALSGPRWLRRRMVATQGTPLRSVIQDESRLEELVRSDVRPASHATSTCAMGDPSHKFAVTDSRCRVIGVRGLRVVDCSIFPTSVRAGTHIPVIMAAEHAADLIVADARMEHTRVVTC